MKEQGNDGLIWNINGPFLLGISGTYTKIVDTVNLYNHGFIYVKNTELNLEIGNLVIKDPDSQCPSPTKSPVEPTGKIPSPNFHIGIFGLDGNELRTPENRDGKDGEDGEHGTDKGVKWKTESGGDGGDGARGENGKNGQNGQPSLPATITIHNITFQAAPGTISIYAKSGDGEDGGNGGNGGDGGAGGTGSQGKCPDCVTSDSGDGGNGGNGGDGGDGGNGGDGVDGNPVVIRTREELQELFSRRSEVSVYGHKGLKGKRGRAGAAGHGGDAGHGGNCPDGKAGSDGSAGIDGEPGADGNEGVKNGSAPVISIERLNEEAL